MSPSINMWPFILGTNVFTLKYDYDGSNNQVYVGWTQPGTASSSTGWRIMKQNYNASNFPTDVQWPNASTAFDFIWDQRSAYSYS